LREYGEKDEGAKYESFHDDWLRCGDELGEKDVGELG
jgi:hypothetical protein